MCYNSDHRNAHDSSTSSTSPTLLEFEVVPLFIYLLVLSYFGILDVPKVLLEHLVVLFHTILGVLAQEFLRENSSVQYLPFPNNFIYPISPEDSVLGLYRSSTCWSLSGSCLCSLRFWFSRTKQISDVFWIVLLDEKLQIICLFSLKYFFLVIQKKVHFLGVVAAIYLKRWGILLPSNVNSLNNFLSFGSVPC